MFYDIFKCALFTSMFTGQQFSAFGVTLLRILVQLPPPLEQWNNVKTLVMNVHSCVSSFVCMRQPKTGTHTSHISHKPPQGTFNQHILWISKSHGSMWLVDCPRLSMWTQYRSLFFVALAILHFSSSLIITCDNTVLPKIISELWEHHIAKNRCNRAANWAVRWYRL